MEEVILADDFPSNIDKSPEEPPSLDEKVGF